MPSRCIFFFKTRRAWSTLLSRTRTCKECSFRLLPIGARCAPDPQLMDSSSYGAGSPFVEHTEAFLRLDRHVGDTDGTAHERRPGLLGRRLKVRKIPELPFLHLNLADIVIEHPGSQDAEPALLRVGEHRLRQRLSHGPPPRALFFHRVLLAVGKPLIPCAAA